MDKPKAEKQKSTLLYKIISRLNYSQKFLIIVALFTFSLLVSGFFMIKSQQEIISRGRLELKGIQYQRSLQKLLETIPQQEWKLYSFLAGNNSLKTELQALSNSINNHFKELISIDQELQNALVTNPRDLQLLDIANIKPSQLEVQWNDLDKRASSLTPNEVLVLFNQLITNLKQLMFYIGETSTLIIDPSIEGNYLIQIMLWDLTRAKVLIPKINISLQDIESKNQSDPDRTQELAILVAQLQEELKDTVQDTKSALRKQTIAKGKGAGLSDESLMVPLNKYLNTLNDFLVYIKDNFIDENSRVSLTPEYIDMANKTLDYNTALWNAVCDRLEEIIQARIARFTRQQVLSIAFSLISALVAMTLGFFMMRQISSPLNNLVDAAKRLASGDLSTRVNIPFESEVGQVGSAFNKMAETFQELITKLQRNGIQLTTSTSEIAAIAKQQEASIVEQETTTKEIAATAQNISNTAKEFAKTMNDVSTNAEQTSSLAASGKAGLNQMEIIMRQMVDASQNIASKLAVLNEKAGNITSVITTITKVADQTNLLSLNAAIEAEKAGEHGRTFSVIAREIRRLADQTGNATLDIEKMVNEMVSAVSAGVMSVDKFSEEIHTGVSQVSTVGEQLTKIIEQVQGQTASFENVNKGMQGQSLGAEQINESITQLSEAAQQASESIRQFHNAIEQVNNVAQEMQASVAKIKH